MGLAQRPLVEAPDFVTFIVGTSWTRPRAVSTSPSATPRVIDVVEAAPRDGDDQVTTEPGAHTTALDVRTHRLNVFLPKTHRAAVFVDGWTPRSTRGASPPSPGDHPSAAAGVTSVRYVKWNVGSCQFQWMASNRMVTTHAIPSTDASERLTPRACRIR